MPQGRAVDRINAALKVAADRHAEMRKLLDASNKAHGEKLAQLEKELAEARERARVRPGGVSIGMRDDELRKYSLVSAIKAMATGDLSGAKFERECHEEQLKAMRDVGWTPKALTLGNNPSAGFLVPNQVMNEVIELRRASLVMDKLGVRKLSGLQYAPVTFPRQTAAATVSWGAEAAAVTPTDQTVDQVNLSPKISKTATDLSNELIAKGGPGAEAFVRADLAEATIREHENVFFEGSGAAGEPKGMATWAGNTESFSGNNADVDLSDFAKMIQLLAADNIPTDRLAWVFNSSDWWLIAQWNVALSSASAGATTTPSIPYVLYTNGGDPTKPFVPYLHGYPVHHTTNVTAGTVFLADWPDTIFADWGAPVIRATSEGRTNVLANQTTIALFAEVDVSVRHTESVCTGTSFA